MRIGMVTDSLSHLPLDELLRTAAELGIAMLEFPCGNWSSAPHLKLDAYAGQRGGARRVHGEAARSWAGAERAELLRQSAASGRDWGGSTRR